MLQDRKIKKISEIGDKYERNVAHFLHNIEFDFIESRFELKKAGKIIGEIDLIFAFDKYLFLIEVNADKSVGRQKKFTFFSQWENEGYLQTIREKFNASHKKIIKIYFDFTKNTFKEESDSISAHLDQNRMNGIAYKEDFVYFTSCVNKIGKWARNDFLDWMGLSDQTKFEETEAFQYYIDNIPIFCFVKRVDALLQSCYISRRRRSSPDMGYQRTLDEKRISKIQNSIEKKEGLAFPNSILISTPNLTEAIAPPHECPKRTKIHFPVSYCSNRIIDGQHRLLGFSRMQDSDLENYFLTVIALPAIEKKVEFKTFIDINYTQQKMDNNLLLHLKSDFKWEPNTKEFYESIAVKVAEKLNEKVFKDRIYFGTADERKMNKITLVTIVSALKGNNQIRDSVEETYQNLSEILSLVGKHMHDHLKPGGYFGQNRGIRVLCRLANLYQRNVMANKVNVLLDGFFHDLSKILNKKMIEVLNDYYGEGGADAAAKELIIALRKNNKTKYKNMQSDLRGI